MFTHLLPLVYISLTTQAGVGAAVSNRKQRELGIKDMRENNLINFDLGHSPAAPANGGVSLRWRFRLGVVTDRVSLCKLLGVTGVPLKLACDNPVHPVNPVFDSRCRVDRINRINRKKASAGPPPNTALEERDAGYAQVINARALISRPETRIMRR